MVCALWVKNQKNPKSPQIGREGKYNRAQRSVWVGGDGVWGPAAAGRSLPRGGHCRLGAHSTAAPTPPGRNSRRGGYRQTEDEEHVQKYFPKYALVKPRLSDGGGRGHLPLFFWPDNVLATY